MSVELVAGPLSLLAEGIFFYLLQEGLLPDMRTLLRFFKDAGYIAGGSVLLAITLFAVSILEHAKNRNVDTWWLWFIAITLWCYGCVVAWYRQYKKVLDRDAEIESLNKGSHVTGEIQVGNLDFRYPGIVDSRFVWHDFQHRCFANFWVAVVNNNPDTAYFNEVMGPPARVEVRIDGSIFRGSYFLPVDGLAVKDARRVDKNDKRVGDSFFGPLRAHGMMQSKPWAGNISFNIIGLNKDTFKGETTIRSHVIIELIDTRGKPHRLEHKNMELLIGKICEFDHSRHNYSQGYLDSL